MVEYGQNIEALRRRAEEADDSKASTATARSNLETASEAAGGLPEAIDVVMALAGRLSEATLHTSQAITATIDKSGAAAGNLSEATTYLGGYEDELGF